MLQSSSGTIGAFSQNHKIFRTQVGNRQPFYLCSSQLRSHCTRLFQWDVEWFMQAHVILTLLICQEQIIMYLEYWPQEVELSLDNISNGLGVSRWSWTTAEDVVRELCQFVWHSVSYVDTVRKRERAWSSGESVGECGRGETWGKRGGHGVVGRVWEGRDMKEEEKRVVEGGRWRGKRGRARRGEGNRGKEIREKGSVIRR